MNNNTKVGIAVEIIAAKIAMVIDKIINLYVWTKNKKWIWKGKNREEIIRNMDN